MQEIWNIVILSSKDKHYETEYRNLMTDVTAMKIHNNIRYIIYEYDHDAGPENTKIFEFPFTNERVEISAKDHSDLYKKEDLINFFKNVVIRSNSEGILNRYMIITWGHGAGLGVFAKIETPPLKKVLHHDMEVAVMDENIFKLAKETADQIVLQQVFLNANNLINEIDLHSNFSPIIKTFELAGNLKKNDENLNALESFKEALTATIPPQLKMLSGANLADIFSQSFPKEAKVDVLITVNCYTQCLEFGNRLRDAVSLLVAPQTMIPFEGINYYQLFKYINDNRDRRIETGQIARNITSCFWSKYDLVDLDTEFSKNYPGFPLKATSFSCNNLAIYADIESVIGETGHILNQLCVYEKIKIKFFITRARNRCQDLTASGDYGMIDFTVFFQNIISILNTRKDELKDADESILTLIARLNTLYVDFVIKLRTTCCLSLSMSQSEAYIQNDANITDGNINLISRSPFFLSIFFPNEQNSAMIGMLKQPAMFATGIGIKTSFNYDDWRSFVKNLYAK